MSRRRRLLMSSLRTKSKSALVWHVNVTSPREAREGDGSIYRGAQCVAHHAERRNGLYGLSKGLENIVKRISVNCGRNQRHPPIVSPLLQRMAKFPLGASIGACRRQYIAARNVSMAINLTHPA